MYQEGERLTKKENFTDHYRWYMDLKLITEKLEKRNFSILYKIESNGLVIFKEENPAVIRLIAKINSNNTQ